MVKGIAKRAVKDTAKAAIGVDQVILGWHNTMLISHWLGWGEQESRQESGSVDEYQWCSQRTGHWQQEQRSKVIEEYVTRS